MNFPLNYPDYTTLSRRLSELNIKSPRYTKHIKMDENIAAIAIDSTDLKRFGRDEWHIEKHNVNPCPSWRKAHFGIDENHYIIAATLTHRFSHDDEYVCDLLSQINNGFGHLTAYDESLVCDKLSAYSPSSNIIIPPAKNAVFNSKSHKIRNRNIWEIKENGCMAWQRYHNYGQRNYFEVGVQRYKRILGRAMHAGEFKICLDPSIQSRLNCAAKKSYQLSIKS